MDNGWGCLLYIDWPAKVFLRRSALSCKPLSSLLSVLALSLCRNSCAQVRADCRSLSDKFSHYVMNMHWLIYMLCHTVIRAKVYLTYLYNPSTQHCTWHIIRIQCCVNKWMNRSTHTEEKCEEAGVGKGLGFGKLHSWGWGQREGGSCYFPSAIPALLARYSVPASHHSPCSFLICLELSFSVW